jgi:Tfp pilus assembly protein PilN
MRAVNLIPADARGGSRFGGLEKLNPVTVAVLGGLVAALVVVTALVFINNKTNDRHAEAARVQTQVTEVQRRADELSPDFTAIQARERSVAAARSLAGTRYNWSRLLGSVSGSLPRNAKLTGFNGTIGAPTSPSTTAATPGTPTGAGSVALTGCAQSLTTVARTMSRLRTVDGVAGVTFSTSEKGANNPNAGHCRNAFSLTLILTGPETPPPTSLASATTTTGATP